MDKSEDEAEEDEDQMLQQTDNSNVMLGYRSADTEDEEEDDQEFDASGEAEDQEHNSLENEPTQSWRSRFLRKKGGISLSKPRELFRRRPRALSVNSGSPPPEGRTARVGHWFRREIGELFHHEGGDNASSNDDTVSILNNEFMEKNEGDLM